MRGPAWFAAKQGKRDKNHGPIRDALRQLGHVVADLAGAADGVADLAVLPRNGSTGGWRWLELKTEKGALTQAQKRLHAEWAAKGVKIHVVHNLDEALEALK